MLDLEILHLDISERFVLNWTIWKCLLFVVLHVSPLFWCLIDHAPWLLGLLPRSVGFKPAQALLRPTTQSFPVCYLWMRHHVTFLHTDCSQCSPHSGQTGLFHQKWSNMVLSQLCGHNWQCIWKSSTSYRSLQTTLTSECRVLVLVTMCCYSSCCEAPCQAHEHRGPFIAACSFIYLQICNCYISLVGYSKSTIHAPSWVLFKRIKAPPCSTRGACSPAVTTNTWELSWS